MSLYSRLWWLVPGITASVCGMAEVGWAQSITPAQDGTATRVTHEGHQYDIDGGTLSGDRQNLFHSFERMGLNADEIANFIANPQIQNILGRVTGGDASILDGLVRVQGSDANLYLMNPAGIVFGPNARLDLAGSFTATTATGIGFEQGWFSAVGSSDYDALVGNPSSFAFGLSQPGAIVNLGTLAVDPGQSLTLMGGTVVNTGTLAAPGGTVTVAAVPGENRIRLSQAGNLLSLEIEPLSGSGPNAVQLAPAQLPQLLTGGDLAGATALTVDADGTVRLGGSGTAIPINGGSAVIAGTVTTAAPTAAESQIALLGDRLLLLGATVDASGEGGGGTIRIGGDYQGQQTLPAATQTWVDRESAIAADALTQGDGGRVILWSENGTRFDGTLTARGGAAAGDGGFVEVSGRNGLQFDGTVDVSAPAGTMGTLLLDPASVVIGAVGTDNAELNDGQILGGDAPGTTFLITADRVVQLLNTSNVIITASTNIDITSAIDASANLLGSELTLTAPAILLDAAIALNNGALTFNGDVTVGTASASQLGLTSLGGTITFNGTVDRPVGFRPLSVSGDQILFTDTVGGANPMNIQLIGRDASFTSSGTTQLDGFSTGLTGSLRLAGQNFDIQNATIATQGRLTAPVQNLILSNSSVNSSNLSVQAGTINLTDVTLRSRQDIVLQAQTNLTIRNDVIGANLLLAGRNLQLTAQTGALQIQDSAADPMVVEAGQAIALQGGSGITINALTNSGSVFRSTTNTTLISDNPIIANGRFGAGGDFAVLNTLGNPRAFTTTSQDANGVISASGNVTFGDYSGVSLWVEALGRIQAGNIVITGPNTALTGTDPEVALLSDTGSVILRAGVTQLSNPVNLAAPTVVAGTTFTPAPATGGNLTVGTINAGFDGRVILSASGSINTGDISGPAGIDLTAAGDITTGRLDSGVSGDTLDYGQIRLGAGGDITVGSIDAGAGGVDVTAAGSFRVVGYSVGGLLEQVVPLRGNTELINYLISQGVPANLFDDPNAIAPFISVRTGSLDGTFDPTRTDNPQFPTSIIARPSNDVITSSGFNAPVVIRYGGAESTLVDDQFSVGGLPGRITILGSGESFVTGPVVTAGTPELVPESPTDTFASFNPTLPFNLRINNGYGLRPASALTDASGTVGAIAVGSGSNINLYGSLQNNTFEPIPPDGGGGGNGGGGNGGGGNGGGGNGGGGNGGGGNGGGNGGGGDGDGVGSNGNGTVDTVAIENTADQSQQDRDSNTSETCDSSPGLVPAASGAIALRDAGTTPPPCTSRSAAEPLLQVQPGVIPQPAIAPASP